MGLALYEGGYVIMRPHPHSDAMIIRVRDEGCYEGHSHPALGGSYDECRVDRRVSGRDSEPEAGLNLDLNSPHT